MNKTYPINDILLEALKEIKTTYNVSSFEYDSNTNTTKLNVCDTAYIDDCYKVLNGCCEKVIVISDKNNEFPPIEIKVNDFKYCDFIEFEGQLQPLITKKNCYQFTIPVPRWIEGSYATVSSEVDQIDECNKYPLVYLLNPFKEQFNNDKKLCYDRLVTVTIFFIGLINLKGAVNVSDKEDDQHTKDLKTQAKPMRNLAESFICAMDKSKGVQEVDNYNITTYNCFTKGRVNSEEWFFNDFTNGVQLDVTFKTKKGYNKKTCCNNT